MKDDRFLKFTLSLSRMNKKVQAVKTAGMGMVGLKAAHTAVLYALSGHSEGLQFAEVAAACDLDPALISRTFSELIAAGMVEKQGEPGRYRARYVLTEQGSLQKSVRSSGWYRKMRTKISRRRICRRFTGCWNSC